MDQIFLWRDCTVVCSAVDADAYYHTNLPLITQQLKVRLYKTPDS